MVSYMKSINYNALPFLFPSTLPYPSSLPFPSPTFLLLPFFPPLSFPSSLYFHLFPYLTFPFFSFSLFPSPSPFHFSSPFLLLFPSSPLFPSLSPLLFPFPSSLPYSYHAALLQLIKKKDKLFSCHTTFCSTPEKDDLFIRNGTFKRGWYTVRKGEMYVYDLCYLNKTDKNKV